MFIIRYLALDLSISSTGYAVIDENENIITYGKIQTKKQDFETEDKRICYICSVINELIINYKIDVGLFEDQFTGKNVKTAMILRKCLGAVMKTFNNHNIDCKYMSPTEVRKILCNLGNSTKEKVANHIRKHYLDLGELNDRNCKAKNSDIYDAIGLGMSYIKLNKRVI